MQPQASNQHTSIQRHKVLLKKESELPQKLIPKIEGIMRVVPEIIDKSSISERWTFPELMYSVVCYLNSLEESKLVDTDFLRHSIDVTELSLDIASQMKLECYSREIILWAGLLHDVGKQNIPPELWGVPKSKLEAKNQWYWFAAHSTDSSEIARGLLSGVFDKRTLDEITVIIHFHHERYDGKGYPHHMVGEEIPICSRILAVADVYDALTHARPYRSWTYTKAEAITYMREKERQKHDIKVLDAFLDLVRKKSYSL